MKQYIPDLRDVFTFGGMGLLGFGLYMVYPPATFIILGLICLYLGLWK
jgi:hypothetical protein